MNTFSLAGEIKAFVKKLPYWIENALEDSPEHLMAKKLEGKNSYKCFTLLTTYLSYIFSGQEKKNK